MNRLAGIVVAAAGFIVAILGVLKIVPGVTSTGVGVILFGGLIIGLSFVKGPPTEGVERMSTPATLLNIFVSPGEVFQNLRRHPRWLVALLLMGIFSSVFTNLFMQRLTPERVANYAIDKTLEMSFLNEEARKQIEAGRADAVEQNKNPVLRTAQAVSSFVGLTFFYAFLAAIFFLIVLAMGGSINYWQAFSAAIYASFPVYLIRYFLSTIILYIKDPVDIHPITGQTNLVQDNLSFLFVPSEHPVLYSVLGFIGLLTLYWVWLNATGLRNAGERVTGSTAWTASLGLFVVLILLVALMAFLFPSFVS